jgi:hypothetical protein
MSNKEQTSIEYLIKEFSEILGPIETKPMQDLLLMDAMKKAKAMHKEEIENAWRSFDGKTFEQYYNETYGNNTP